MANGYYKGKGGNVYNKRGEIVRVATPASNRRGAKVNANYTSMESAGTPF